MSGMTQGVREGGGGSHNPFLPDVIFILSKLIKIKHIDPVNSF